MKRIEPQPEWSAPPVRTDSGAWAGWLFSECGVSAPENSDRVPPTETAYPVCLDAVWYWADLDDVQGEAE